MDLTINIEDYKLNIRAAAVIKHSNKILVHKNINKDHYALLGGRVEIGESSKETILREAKEELGKDISIKGYIATIENFFILDNQKYHEILFVYEAEFVNEEDKLIETELKNVEGKDYLKYMWLNLDNIDEYNVVPKSVIEIIKNSNYPIHKINDDIK